jgi:hypothetical protein
MAHYAKVLDGKVKKVIVADAEFFETFVDDEPGEWVQTSYNTHLGVHYDPETGEPSADQSKALRYNYAGVGYIYDSEADAFYAPQPFDSWTLNTDKYIWECPIPYPKDGGVYNWNEDVYQADTSDPKTAGWVPRDSSV